MSCDKRVDFDYVDSEVDDHNNDEDVMMYKEIIYTFYIPNCLTRCMIAEMTCCWR